MSSIVLLIFRHERGEETFSIETNKMHVSRLSSPCQYIPRIYYDLRFVATSFEFDVIPFVKAYGQRHEIMMLSQSEANVLLC